MYKIGQLSKTIFILDNAFCDERKMPLDYQDNSKAFFICEMGTCSTQWVGLGWDGLGWDGFVIKIDLFSEWFIGLNIHLFNELLQLYQQSTNHE